MTTGASALDPVMAGAITALDVASFLALCPGGVWDEVPPETDYEYAWITLREDPRPLSTFGALLTLVEMRLHVYSVRSGTKQLDLILSEAARLLHHTKPALTGWTTEFLRFIGSYATPDVEIGGQRVHQKVGMFEWSVERAA